MTAARAALQSAGFAGFLYLFIYGSALLEGGDRFGNPVLHVFVTGAVALLAVGLLVARDPRPLESLGLTRLRWWKAGLFGLGGVAAIYALNAVLTLGYLAVAGGVREKVAQKADWAFGLASIPWWWVLPLTLFVGFYEEVAFRGFLLRRLGAALEGQVPDPRRRLYWAAALSGLAFGGLHGYQGALGLLQTAAVGVALGLLAVWTRSTWPPIVAHFTIDAFGLFALKVLKPMAEEALRSLQKT